MSNQCVDRELSFVSFDQCFLIIYGKGSWSEKACEGFIMIVHTDMSLLRADIVSP